HTAVEKLQQQVNMLNGNGLERLNSAVNNSASALSRLSQAQSQQNSAAQQAILQQQRLATETARTATQQQRLQTESAKTATQQARLSTETQRTTTQTQRLATETQRTAAAQSNAATAAIRQQQAQARLDQTLNGSSRAASNASGSLALLAKQYLSLAAAAVAAKQALDLATTYTVVNNKIKTVTESVGQQETLLKRLTQTALETSTGIDVVSQAFIRFDRPMAQMGKSQEETLRLITTINKELANTGATTSEAASAVLQLGQAFGSGLLQGDEFRSLAENMPTLLD
ncbi:TPA: tape measure protein, partial [Salmonella enterica]|nr:tape measure protein [Salmonella enterica]